MSALHKTFGSVQIKSLDEEKRTFTGIASTPNQDRAKDVMVPKVQILKYLCLCYFTMTQQKQLVR